MRRRVLPTALLLTLAAGTPVGADLILLTSGERLQADQAWYEKGELRYRKDGTVFRLPHEVVARVETALGPLVDPDVTRSSERLLAGDPAEALRFARLALFRDPLSVPALAALAAAQTTLGDALHARQSAESALALEPSSPRLRELLGDALGDLGDYEGAREAYRLALEKVEEPRVRGKLDALSTSTARAPSPSSARFRLRYDGAADEPMGLAVLGVLDQAWDEYQARLGFTPSAPVTVVLQTATSFRDTTRAPEWVAAWNDGTIRVPVMGLATPTPGLLRVLRHELVHSFVASRAGTACPTWLHEGLAQWLEGGDPRREDAALAPLARQGRTRRLQTLEAPFVGLTQAQASVAYAQSLSTIAWIVRARGEAAVRRLVEALGEGHTPAEALRTALATSYEELQKDWEKGLAESVRGAGL